MPEDTQNLDQCPFKESILSLLRAADENMLLESGNPVYIKLKAEVDQYRAEQSENHSKGQPADSTRKGPIPNSLLDAPILGVRISPQGYRLVYRVNRPPDERLAELQPGKGSDDPDKTLVDIKITPDTKASNSESK